MDIRKKRLIFMGTPEISARLLEALIIDGYNFVAVVTRVDAPVGRNKVFTPPPVKLIAQKYNIPVFQFVKVRLEYEILLSLHAEAIICLAYGQIIPEELLKSMSIGSLNFHGSLLPKYRGAAPLQRAIMCGENESGVTAMEMVKEMDAGQMYGRLCIPIANDDNFTSYREKFIQALIPFALKIIPKYLCKEIVGEEQDAHLVTFAPPIRREEHRLSLELPKIDFVNHVRGLSDEPGAYLIWSNQNLKIYKAHIISDYVINKVGNINSCDKNGIIIQLKDGEVSLDLLQLPGKKELTCGDFLNGCRNFSNNPVE